MALCPIPNSHLQFITHRPKGGILVMCQGASLSLIHTSSCVATLQLSSLVLKSSTSVVFATLANSDIFRVHPFSSHDTPWPCGPSCHIRSISSSSSSLKSHPNLSLCPSLLHLQYILHRHYCVPSITSPPPLSQSKTSMR